MMIYKFLPRRIYLLIWFILLVATAFMFNSYILFTIKDKIQVNIINVSELKSGCFNGKDIDSVEGLSVFLNFAMLNKNKMCRQTYDLFHSVYNVRIKYTQIYISSTFRERLQKWLNSDQSLMRSAENQSLVFIDNLYSHESVVFNQVRSNRPGVSSNGTSVYLQELMLSSKEGCDFCSYEKYTAFDSFGFMKSKYAVIVSNAFKIEIFHGMLLWFQHDYKRISEVEYMSGINLALKWFHKTHSLIPTHDYRIMYWDILPKASASQVHPHVHLTLGDYSYYSKWNSMYHAALRYFNENNGSDYFQQLIDIHDLLGLVFKFGNATLLIYLTPQKEYEVLVISRKPCQDFFRLSYYTYQVYINVLNEYAISSGYVFPKLNSNSKLELPMMLRMVSRGPADNMRSDISSFDLFGTANVNSDPFKLMKKVHSYLVESMKNIFQLDEDWSQEH
ncbi:uncharacterized protein LOC105844215 [Hydra vulgaris]|uniref:uncharacterized protein LOC105844215 n=1 Tax=Hydra vulgaris TaxID=6087 RepID=UPI0006415667|nr:uncharacterized protein LOC105844215 [Hydra vulgaris]XP_047122860.1 uncharacterized protein LOC105844215 [Hydra vulgaris]